MNLIADIRYRSSLFLMRLFNRRFFASSKVYDSPKAAVADVRDGSIVLSGGFGLCGIAENLLAAVKDKGVKDLTVVTNNGGVRLVSVQRKKR